ncbi:hypothetical protein LTR94_023155 [Friedmanniomyces endolithicus]|nr:hypothetical protein LTR94_023155 [Friedmanniomyces endolithicus]
MLKQTLLYTGKAKSVYETDSADHLILVFRDDASAFNGEKIEQLDRKGVEEGKELTPPTFELFFKDDALGDPMVNESQAIALGWATAEQLEQMKVLTYQVNEVLKNLFDQGGMLLVDFKLEFGVFHDRIVLGDEFSPDGCRLWDKETKKKLDKDRFRQGLGGVVEAYEEVAARLGIDLSDI